MLKTRELARARWFDLHKSTDDERKEVERELGFSLPDPETIREIEASSRVRRQADSVSLNVPHFCLGEDEAGPLGFVLTPRLLVTQHSMAHRVLDKVATDIGTAKGSTDLFLRVLEHITDLLADSLESIEGEVATTAKHVFQRTTEKKLKPILRRVGEIGAEMARTHNTLLGLLRIVSHLKQDAPKWYEETDGQRTMSIYDDLKSLNEFEEQLGDRLQFLLDGVLGQINIDQNEIMKVMTVASVVGIPPTVLVGVWGMNFQHMPELAWPVGYPIALAVVVASAVLPLLWFKAKGWI